MFCIQLSNRGAIFILIRSLYFSGSGATTAVGFGVVIGHEDFATVSLVHISIKPEESDLKNCFIVEFELYSQIYLALIIYIAIITHIFALEIGPDTIHIK